MREVSAREAKRIAAEAADMQDALNAETASAFQRIFGGVGGKDEAAIVRDYLRKWCGAAPDAPIPTFDPLSTRNTDYNLGRLAVWQHIEYLLAFDLESEGDEARQRQDTNRRARRRQRAAPAEAAGDLPSGDEA